MCFKISTMSAITSKTWISRPPTLKPNPKSQSINKMMIMVQSMVYVFHCDAVGYIKRLHNYSCRAFM